MALFLEFIAGNIFLQFERQDLFLDDCIWWLFRVEISHYQALLFLYLNVLAEFLLFCFCTFFHTTKAIDAFVSVSSLLHLCHTLPAKKDLKKTVEFDIGFAIARIWSTASNSMNSLNTANLMEIYTVCKLFMSALCAK